MSRHCAKCRGIPQQEVRIGAEWLPVCSKACGAALVPGHDLRARIGRALDAALIGPEQDAAAESDAFADAPDEVIVTVLENYPPNQLLRFAGTSGRMRDIVFDPRTIARLMSVSFARQPDTAYNAWMALARQAARAGTRVFAATVLGALLDYPSPEDLVKPILPSSDTVSDFLASYRQPTKRAILTHFALALRTDDAALIQRVGARIDLFNLVEYFTTFVLELQSAAALDAFLKSLNRDGNRFLFSINAAVRREVLFANVDAFNVLLNSGNWQVQDERAQMVNFNWKLDDPAAGLLMDAIFMRKAAIVQLLIADGRIPTPVSLLEIATSDEITEMLLRVKKINPFGYRTLAELHAPLSRKYVKLSPPTPNERSFDA